MHASERDRPDVQARRKLWKEQQSRIDASRLVFLLQSMRAKKSPVIREDFHVGVKEHDADRQILIQIV